MNKYRYFVKFEIKVAMSGETFNVEMEVEAYDILDALTKAIDIYRKSTYSNCEVIVDESLITKMS